MPHCQDTTTPLDQNSIYTLLGMFDSDNNEFIDENGNKYHCIAYGIIRKAIEGHLVVVNITFEKNIGWVIFQYLIIE